MNNDYLNEAFGATARDAAKFADADDAAPRTVDDLMRVSSDDRAAGMAADNVLDMIDDGQINPTDGDRIVAEYASSLELTRQMVAEETR